MAMTTIDDFAPGDRVMVIEPGEDANLIGTVLECEVIHSTSVRQSVQVDLEPNALGRRGGWVWMSSRKLAKLPASEGP